MFSAQNILAVTVVMKMVLNSLFIVQCAVVAEAWNMQNASCGASCHQRIITQRAIPTCDIFLVVIILSSIIQCSMIYNKMLSLNTASEAFTCWETIASEARPDACFLTLRTVI